VVSFELIVWALWLGFAFRLAGCRTAVRRRVSWIKVLVVVCRSVWPSRSDGTLIAGLVFLVAIAVLVVPCVWLGSSRSQLHHDREKTKLRMRENNDSASF